MKILQITSVPIWFKGGAEKIVYELATQMAKKHKVTVLQTDLYEEEKKYPKKTKQNGIEIITCKNTRHNGGYGYSVEFKRELQKIAKEYDIVHIHGHGRYTSNVALKLLEGEVPIIYTAHGFFHSKKHKMIKKVHDILFGKRIENATYVTALNPIEVQQYIKLGIKKEKIVMLPNWINTKEFKIKRNKQKFLQKYKLPYTTTIISSGRIHESKGHQYVIEATKDMQVNTLIVGRDTGYKKELEKKIEEHKIKDKVKIIESPTDKERNTCYINSDIFVLFSEWEGFGIVVLEAMVSNLPPVVSDKGALPLWITKNVNGLIAQYPSVKNLREKIQILMSNKKLRKKIQANNKRYIKQYEIEHVIKKYEDLYKKAYNKQMHDNRHESITD